MGALNESFLLLIRKKIYFFDYQQENLKASVEKNKQ